MYPRLLASLITAISVAISWAAQSVPTDSARTEHPDTITLSTVHVQAKSYRQKGDHVDIYLTKANEEFGTNALDAVSSLPFFNENIGEKALSTLSRENVTILINGVPSDGMDLRGYQSNEIKKVEFYESAPLKYINLTKGPLVNIITRKKIDRLYSAYLNGWNSNRPNGEYQAVLTYADSLHQVKINGYTNYGKNKRDIFTSYDYPDGITNRYTGKDSRNSYKGFTINPSYQYYDNKNLFNASLNLRSGDNKEHTPTDYCFSDKGTIYEGSGGKHLKTSNFMSSLSLYYNHTFAPAKSFTVMLSGGYADALSRNHIWRGSTQSEQVVYDIFNRVKNKAYSLRGSINYSAGSSYLGANYTYSKIDQNSDGSIYHPTTQNVTIFGGYAINRENMGFYPALGAIMDHTSSMGIHHTTFDPYIQLLYRAWVSEGQFNGLSGSLSMSVMSTGVGSIGSLTAAETFIDNRFIAIGNPDIKASWCALPKLRLTYYRPDGKVNIDFTYSISYYHHNNAPVIFESNGNYYQTIADLGHLWSHTISFNTEWRPLGWLRLNPYLEYNKKIFSTPSHHVNYNHLRAGGSVAFMIKEFYISLSANSPTKVINGDLTEYGSGQYSIGGDWGHRNFSFGMRFHIMDHRNYTRANSCGFRYKDRTDNRNYVILRASLYLSRGKVRRQPGVSGAAGVDNGLTSTQQPKN